MNLKEIFAQEYITALYQDVKYGHVYLSTFYGERDSGLHVDAVRLSVPLPVRFDQIPHDEIIQNAVAAMDAAELAVREDMQKKINEIRERKQKLLALTSDQEIVS